MGAMRESELLQETDTLKSASSGTETLQARVSSLEQRESELLQEMEGLQASVEESASGKEALQATITGLQSKLEAMGEGLTPEEEEELWQSLKDLEEKLALKTQEAEESHSSVAALTARVAT